MLSSTNPGDVILDPFFGTGTTGAVAKKLGRKYIGIEQEEHYIKYAKRRLGAIRQIADDTALEPSNKKTEPRIPFGSVIEHGLIKPGAKLFDSKRRYCATVKADGSVYWGSYHGSIHQMGAKAAGLPSCNGWTFWHFQDKKKENLLNLN